MASTIDQYIADLQNEYNMGRLNLDRDRYNNIDLPTYQNVTFPSSVAANTGFLPTGYAGGYGGMASAGFLGGSAELFGQLGSNLDPRYAALGYTADQRTLGGRQLDLQGDIARANLEHQDREFQAGRSDADRTFAEMQRAQIQQQTNQDLDTAMKLGLPPNGVVSGQVVPAWLQPHADWARQYAVANAGAVPTYNALVGQLGKVGLRPEDFNGGQPYPGTLPTVGPGIVQDPSRGGLVDYSQGDPNGVSMPNDQYTQATIQRRQAAAPQVTMTANGPVYAQTGLPFSTAQAADQTQSGGFAMVQGDDPNARQTGGNAVMRAQGGMVADPSVGANAVAAQGGATQFGGNAAVASPATLAAINQGFGAYNVGGLNYGGSGATGAIGQGQPMSEFQRNLVEQGRQSDIQAQLTANAQRIQEENNQAQIELARGNLDLARQHEQNAKDLQTRSLDLQQQQQQFQQGISAGELTGSYNGQDTLAKQQLTQQQSQFVGQQTGTVNGSDTLDKGALLGQFNGQSTLAGQQAYGGSALVGGGLTLDAQQALGYVGGQSTLARQAQEDQTALQYQQLAADLSRNPADWVRYSTMLGGTPGGIRDIVDASAGRYNMARFGDYGAGGTGGMQTPGGVAAAAGGQAGQQAYVQQQANRLAAPNQLAPQQYQKLGATQKALLGGLYETGSNAYRPEDVTEMYRRSLPRYSGPTRGSYR